MITIQYEITSPLLPFSFFYPSALDAASLELIVSLPNKMCAPPI
jgi:hypothetical protein